MYKSVTELNVGDLVEFYGAQFEIISQSYAEDYRMYFHKLDSVSDVAIPVGKWISGNVIKGYFGPDKNWIFQGNHRHVVKVIDQAA